MALAAPFPAARAARPRPTRPLQAGSHPALRQQPALRLTRRGRLVVGVISVLFLLAVVLLSGALSAQAGSSMADQGRATGVVVVQPGESLWQIARAIAPDADPREVVTRIRELNGLDDAPVVPGQSIVVPVVATAGS